MAESDPGWAAGMCITSSGLQRSDKEALELTVTAAGGRYSPNFSRRSTHLVVQPKARAALSQKMLQAIHNLDRWDARIVSTRWVADSSERQQALPEKEYLPDFVALEISRRQAAVSTHPASGLLQPINQPAVTLPPTTLKKRRNVTVRSRRGISKTAKAQGLSRFATGSRHTTHQPQHDGGTATEHREGLQGDLLEDQRIGQSRATPIPPVCRPAGEKASCSGCREPAEDDADSGPRTEAVSSGHIQQHATKGLAAQRAWQLQRINGTALPNEQPAASAQAATWPAGASANAQPSVPNTLSSSDALLQGTDGSGCSKTGAGSAGGAWDSPANDAALSLLLSRLRAQQARSSLESAAARPAFGLEPVRRLAAHAQLTNFRACSSSFQEQVQPASSGSRWSSRASGGGAAAAVDADALLPTESASWRQQTSSRAESTEPGAYMHQPASLQKEPPAVGVVPDQKGAGPQSGQVAAECHFSQHVQTAVQGDLSELLRRLQGSKAHQQRQQGAGFMPQAATSPSRHTPTNSAHTWPRNHEVSQASSTQGAFAEQLLQTEGNRIQCWSNRPTGADRCGPKPGAWQPVCSAGEQHSGTTAAAAEAESRREAASELEQRQQQSRDRGTAASMSAAPSDAFCAPQGAASSHGAQSHQQGSKCSGVAHLPGAEWHSSCPRAAGEPVNVAERLRGWTSRPRPAAANSAGKGAATAVGTGGTGAPATDKDGEIAEPQGCSKDETGERASASLWTGGGDRLSGAATEAEQKGLPSVGAEVHPLRSSKPWTPPRLCPARMLNGIFWAVSEAVATARMDPSQPGTVPAEDGPANEEHMGSEDFDASQQAAKLLCESLEKLKVRPSVSNFSAYLADSLFATRAAVHNSRRERDTPVGRQLSRAEWDAVVFAGSALTLLLPQDHSGALGHASRILPAPATGLTRRQLLEEIAGFYQAPLSRGGTVSGTAAGDRGYECPAPNRATLLGAHIQLDCLVRVSRSKAASIYELCLTC